MVIIKQKKGKAIDSATNARNDESGINIILRLLQNRHIIIAEYGNR